MFDRGIISEENLEMLRKHDGQYLVGTPRSKLKQFERELLAEGWEEGARQCRGEAAARVGWRRDLHPVPLDRTRV